MKFDELPIHDAILASIHISYEAERCDLILYVAGAPHSLVFEGFRALQFPVRALGALFVHQSGQRGRSAGLRNRTPVRRCTAD